MQLTIIQVEREEFLHSRILERSDRIKSDWLQISNDLKEIKKDKLYLRKAKTFEEYCEVFLDIVKSTANRLIAGSDVVENLNGAHGRHLPTSERQARPLTKLEPELQREAWAEVIEENEPEAITAKIITAKVETKKELNEAVREVKRGNMPNTIFVQTPLTEKEILKKAKEIKEAKREDKNKARLIEINEIKNKGDKTSLINSVKLIEGDLFDHIDSIKDGSIDLLNTDPPYMVLSNDWDTFKDKAEFLKFTEDWLKLVMPKLKSSGRAYISFSQWYQYDLYNILAENDFFGMTYKQNLIWYYKNNNAPSNRKEYRYMYEPIFYLYGKDAKPLNFTPDTYGETQQNVWEIATPQSNFKEGKYHAAQKPLELYKRIIKTGSFEGDLVLDCFAGSGTTGIVCKELKRECILIERDIENIKIIKGRLCE